MSVISYGSDHRQKVWIGANNINGGKWLIVIHGGIWQDQRETYETGINFAVNMANSFNGVASIDYRLSPQVQHPKHLEDCFHAIEYLSAQFEVQEIVIAGHSAGAFIAGQLATFYDLPIKQIIGIESLIDIIDLVDEYPDYFHYIALAFGSDQTKWAAANPKWEGVNLVLIHSKKDELVSLRQPKLCSNAKLIIIEDGTHDQVFQQNLEPLLRPFVDLPPDHVSVGE